MSINFFGDLRLNGNSIIDVSSITGMWGKWSIDENGKVVAKEVETEALKVKESAAFGTPEKRIGITIYDRATGEPVCIFSENRALKSEAGACGVKSESQNSKSETPNQSSPSSDATGQANSNDQSSVVNDQTQITNDQQMTNDAEPTTTTTESTTQSASATEAPPATETPTADSSATSEINTAIE